MDPTVTLLVLATIAGGDHDPAVVALERAVRQALGA